MQFSSTLVFQVLFSSFVSSHVSRYKNFEPLEISRKIHILHVIHFLLIYKQQIKHYEIYESVFMIPIDTVSIIKALILNKICQKLMFDFYETKTHSQTLLKHFRLQQRKFRTIYILTIFFFVLTHFWKKSAFSIFGFSATR